MDQEKTTITRYLTDCKRHLICQPYSIEGLHAMAKALEIKPCWFHKDHYDIPLRRVKEIVRIIRG